ncbi:hypothetical protein QBC43DRAFT_289667 [Cladorrhinum sp. PSN259]|nr:hypothetical protein QBC43DRAFT_289667 [Cladorrhinum sp. PSN259]
MKLQIPFLLALAGTTTAAPAPAELVPRVVDSCPTTSVQERLIWTTSYSTTLIATVYVSSLGSVTSTKTEPAETRRIVRVSTVTFPPTTTIPATTTTTTVAYSTMTQAWFTDTLTVRIPDYSPASFCQITTSTYTIPGSSTYVYWIDTTYLQSWESITGHVKTVTAQPPQTTTSTRTTTVPGTTTYLSTVTTPITNVQVAVITTTITSTLYEKGCKTYACQG